MQLKQAAMRALIQRVLSAHVTVFTDNGDRILGGDRDAGLGEETNFADLQGEITGRIGPGLCVFVGVTHDDDDAKAEKLADKIMNLRILMDEKSVLDTGGEVLVVSQFTLYGETRKGRRPSWIDAARPEHAEPLVEQVVTHLQDAGLTVATGRFRQYMQVALVNDGPTTLSVEV